MCLGLHGHDPGKKQGHKNADEETWSNSSNCITCKWAAGTDADEDHNLQEGVFLCTSFPISPTEVIRKWPQRQTKMLTIHRLKHKHNKVFLSTTCLGAIIRFYSQTWVPNTTPHSKIRPSPGDRVHYVCACASVLSSCPPHPSQVFRTMLCLMHQQDLNISLFIGCFQWDIWNIYLCYWITLKEYYFSITIVEEGRKDEHRGVKKAKSQYTTTWEIGSLLINK